MSKEAEEFFKITEGDEYKAIQENRGHLSWSFRAWMDFAEAYAKHYMKQRLEAETDEKIKKLFRGEVAGVIYKKWLGVRLFKDKLLKELEDEWYRSMGLG